VIRHRVELVAASPLCLPVDGIPCGNTTPGQANQHVRPPPWERAGRAARPAAVGTMVVGMAGSIRPLALT